MFRIEITLPSGETQEHTFPETALSIGRMLGQVQLKDPGVSALHGQLTLEDGEVSYRDLGSAQGSYLPDGTPIRYTVALQRGDKVKIGEHQLALLEFAEPPQAPTSPPKPAKPLVIEQAPASPPPQAKAPAPEPPVDESAAAPPPTRPRRSTRPRFRRSRANLSAASPNPGTKAPAQPSPPTSAPRKPLTLTGLSPSPIQFAGRERAAPRIEAQRWVDAADEGLLVDQSAALLREHRGPLFGSGPILIGAMGLGFVVAMSFTQLGPAFFALLFLVCFAVGVHAALAYSLSVIDLLSEEAIRPLHSWKRAGKLPFWGRVGLFFSLLLSLPVLALPFFVLPVGIFEKKGVLADLRRGMALLRGNLRGALSPLLHFGFWTLATVLCLGLLPLLLQAQLPEIVVSAICAASACICVVMALRAGMLAGLHALRVYFWQRGRENADAPELRPALLLP